MCRPDPSTGDFVCSITDEQAEVLEKVGYKPKRVVFEVESPVVKSKEAGSPKR